MKLTALAVVILTLGIVMGLALHGHLDGPAGAAPKCPPGSPNPNCATPTPTPAPPYTDRAIINDQSVSFNPSFRLVDIDDFTNVATFPLQVSQANCSTTVVSAHNYYISNGGNSDETTLIDTETGAIIATIDSPLQELVQRYELANYSCPSSATRIEPQVKNRAVLMASTFDGSTGITAGVWQLVDTDTGAVLNTYPFEWDMGGYGIRFDCTGRRLALTAQDLQSTSSSPSIQTEIVVDSVTGEVIWEGLHREWVIFPCSAAGS